MKHTSGERIRIACAIVLLVLGEFVQPMLYDALHYWLLLYQLLPLALEGLVGNKRVDDRRRRLRGKKLLKHVRDLNSEINTNKIVNICDLRQGRHGKAPKQSIQLHEGSTFACLRILSPSEISQWPDNIISIKATKNRKQLPCADRVRGLS